MDDRVLYWWIFGGIAAIIITCGVGGIVEWKTTRTYETTVVICDKNLEYDAEDVTYTGSAIDAQGKGYSFTAPDFYNWLTVGTTYKLTVQESALTSGILKRAEVAPAIADTCPRG